MHSYTKKAFSYKSYNILLNKHFSNIINNPSILKSFNSKKINNLIYTQTKNIHFQKPSNDAPNSSTDNFAHHSPLFTSRGKIEEHRSRLFFDTPPVPNRMAKFIFLYFLLCLFVTGGILKSFRRHYLGLFDVKNDCYKKIALFNKALHDTRFTAIQAKNYMINKAVAERYHVALFEQYRKRFSSDNEVVEPIENLPGNYGMPTRIYNHSLDPWSYYAVGTVQDNGLFDNREVGYGK